MHDHDRGLAFDLTTLADRRKALALLGGAGLTAVLAACGSSGGDAAATTTTTTTTAAGATTTTTANQAGPGGPGGPPPGIGAPPGAGGGDSSSQPTDGTIPEETAGPYPGDGSNGPNVLTESGIVRKDLTTSFGSASGVAKGVPLAITFTLLNLSKDDGKPLAGAAVYAWHCDREGRYSLYTEGATEENYCRGVQVSDADGRVTFDSIFPAAYSGRWPHVHVEIYADVDAATSGGTKLRTSQLALPKAACDPVYASDGYEASVANMAQTTLDTDMVFRDGYALELGKITGSVAKGYAVRLDVPI